jgi:hypothetical protein
MTKWKSSTLQSFLIFEMKAKVLACCEVANKKTKKHWRDDKGENKTENLNDKPVFCTTLYTSRKLLQDRTKSCFDNLTSTANLFLYCWGPHPILCHAETPIQPSHRQRQYFPKLLKVGALANPDRINTYFLQAKNRAAEIWCNSPQHTHIIIELTKILAETNQ